MPDPIRPSLPRSTQPADSPPRAEFPTKPPARAAAATPTSAQPRPGVERLVASFTHSRGQAFTAQAGPSAADPTRADSPPTDALHSASWYGAKVAAESACLLPCDKALNAAKLGMDDDGLAQKMLDHFTSGASGPVHVDLNHEFERNPILREIVTSKIEFLLASRHAQGLPIDGSSGSVWVAQNDYGDTPQGEDQQFALGGTFFEFAATGTAGDGSMLVTINVADNYFWSPSDPTRPSQCLHECAVDLVNNGKAFEFAQFGEGQLVVTDPRIGQRMALAAPNSVDGSVK